METATKKSENGSGIPAGQSTGTTPADIQVSKSVNIKVTPVIDAEQANAALALVARVRGRRPAITEEALTDASRRFCGTVDRLQIREMAREARHDIRNQNYACAYVKLNQIYLLAGGP